MRIHIDQIVKAWVQNINTIAAFLSIESIWAGIALLVSAVTAHKTSLSRSYIAIPQLSKFIL